MTILPKEQVGSEVPGLVVHGRSDVGTMQDAMGLVQKDLEGHDMANILGDANESASSFTRVGRKVGVVNSTTNGFPPLELQEGADVWCRTCQNLGWSDPIQCCMGSQVQHKANTHQSKQPSEGW